MVRENIGPVSPSCACLRLRRLLTAEPVGPFYYMKANTDIFKEVYAFENLLCAYLRARRGKGSREEVAQFGWHREASLLALQEELRSGTYRHGIYRQFIVSDSKRREIKAAPFRDRVVHHAVVAELEPIFDKGFIFDTYACRKGKGTRAALMRFERFARVSRYALMMDISKYFASIDHTTLMALVARKVQDERMLTLCRIIIDSSHDAPGRGIPIGNLTSQLFANIYLNELDQYAKHTLRMRRYVRYMDDIVILADDKKELHATKDAVAAFARERLHLSLHPRKVQVLPTAPGVNFLGYRIYARHRLLRTGTVKRFVAHVKDAGGGVLSEDAIRSWLVYARDGASRGLLRSLAERLKEPRFTSL